MRGKRGKRGNNSGIKLFLQNKSKNIIDKRTENGGCEGERQRRRFLEGSKSHRVIL
jgi:hypothetical protein